LSPQIKNWFRFWRKVKIKRPSHKGDGRSLIRGATPVKQPPILTKNPGEKLPGMESQLHSFRVRQNPAYTLCPDNGGNSGGGYWRLRSPCGSKVHSSV